MSKSGRFCNHCGLWAQSKTLTGGGAGGKDPRRDQKEREGYWARSLTHTSTQTHTHITKNVADRMQHTRDERLRQKKNMQRSGSIFEGRR